MSHMVSEICHVKWVLVQIRENLLYIDFSILYYITTSHKIHYFNTEQDSKECSCFICVITKYYENMYKLTYDAHGHVHLFTEKYIF